MKYEVSDVECSMGFSDGGLGSNVVTVTFATWPKVTTRNYARIRSKAEKTMVLEKVFRFSGFHILMHNN